MNAPRLIVVHCLFPSLDEAIHVSSVILSDGLCQSFTALPAGRTYFMTKGRMANAQESLCLLLTSEASYPALEQRLRDVHSYDEPTIFAIPAERATAATLAGLVGLATEAPTGDPEEE